MKQVKLQREALERVARLYTGAAEAALALGCNVNSLRRAMKREQIKPRWAK